jgi:pimeloyl-ACP methyl ester carboxylesterase
MERAHVNGATLEYAVMGVGEPVVCIHRAFVADTFQPLLTQPRLTSRYWLLTYHRRGYAASSRVSGPTSIAQRTADCQALLAHLEVEQAHVVGHSFGGAIALQLALDTPELVHSLALVDQIPLILVRYGPGIVVNCHFRGIALPRTNKSRSVVGCVARDSALR